MIYLEGSFGEQGPHLLNLESTRRTSSLVLLAIIILSLVHFKHTYLHFQGAL